MSEYCEHGVPTKDSIYKSTSARIKAGECPECEIKQLKAERDRYREALIIAKEAIGGECDVDCEMCRAHRAITEALGEKKE